MIRNLTCPEQLEQLKKEFDDFAYIVSHDLKAPIRAISNLSHWIEEDLGDDLNEDVRDNMRLLRNRANRMELMIEALLRYSRVTRHDLELEQTSIPELVKSIAEEFGDKIDIKLPQALPEIYTYRKKLYTVFHHLVDNAVAFSKNGQASITITCHQISNDYLEFSIADNGMGVPEEALDKIFSLFYTVSAKDTHETVGAGLAISKKIVQFVQGTIYAETNNENGLTIRFTWPIKVDTTPTSY